MRGQQQGTRRCGYLNSQHRGKCNSCSRSRLPAFSLPAGSACVPAAVAFGGRAALMPHMYPPSSSAAGAPFIAGSYAGPKPGYVHRTGRLGRGYYLDEDVLDGDDGGAGAAAPPKCTFVEDADGAIDLTLDDD